MTSSDVASAAAARWRGQSGRLEVWYATLSDPVSRAGLWIHHEIVAPTDGGPPFSHGWITWFPAQGEPQTQRLGPEPLAPHEHDGSWYRGAGGRVGPGFLGGSAGAMEWDLRWTDPAAPLWTFPRFVWERELLPGAQVVLAPTAEFQGTLSLNGTAHKIDGWRGAVSHIYGHGNAERWGWIHADLGGQDALEVVTAVSRRPGLRALRPVAFIRLRADGRDWPGSGLPAVRVRTSLDLPRWQLEGRIGKRDIRIRVDQPAERCVSMRYQDPDGAVAVCTNTGQADIHIEVGRHRRGVRIVERSWSVSGTGHAEIGFRGDAAPTVNERSLG
ncbi:hypothetical protein AWC02_09585 [Mycolicibacter engbaekii]|uniref:Tocopherol cyclase n=1 Tax=Mycolicibacter engbaekii TaxID=188915 RepID=A0A1X1TS46_9MYCO|nr:hypothetical protein [Mycolicibacter engbaekii]ORV47353.1 hypothetical protein AWC02_09585 [Mycolicibacter engbaekii]